MKTVRETHRNKESILTINNRALTIIAAALSITCTMILAIISLDGEKYSSADASVTTAITYEEPEKACEKGFWDIFCDSLMGLFF